MKIIFKTETETLKEVEFDKLTSELQEELEYGFDNRPILKYEITFKEGVFVKDCHRMEDITDKQISILTITVV